MGHGSGGCRGGGTSETTSGGGCYREGRCGAGGSDSHGGASGGNAHTNTQLFLLRSDENNCKKYVFALENYINYLIN